MLKYLLYGMPALLLIVVLSLSDGKESGWSLALSLSLFFLIYVIQITLITLSGAQLIVLTLIHFLTLIVTLYLMYNPQLYTHMIGYGIGVCLILWAFGELSEK